MLVKVPVAKSPPAHVKPGPAAAADAVGSTRDAATARSPRNPRRVVLFLSTGKNALSGRGRARVGTGSVSPFGPARRMRRPVRDGALVDLPRGGPASLS